MTAKTNRLLMLALLVGVGSQAQASVIHFEDLKPLANYSFIPDGFGSTAEVAVSYQTLNLDKSWFSDHMQFWNEGYADLPAAAYSDGSGRYGVITFTPTAGYSVNLTGFDMGAYPTGISGRAESVISVLYGANSVDYGPTTLSGVTFTHFAPNVTYSGPVSIIIGTDWNNGINNIEFSVTAVPEPTTMVAGLGALGLLALGLRKRA